MGAIWTHFVEDGISYMNPFDDLIIAARVILKMLSTVFSTIWPSMIVTIEYNGSSKLRINALHAIKCSLFAILTILMMHILV